MDLPDPVEPTRATVRPAGTSNETSVQNPARPPSVVGGSVDAAQPQRGRARRGRGHRAVRHLPGRGEHACCTRSQPTTLRGSSVSTQPIARTGTASTVNRNETKTTAETSTAPWRSRTAPTTSTARVPRLGSMSSIGSKTPRIRPTRIMASRSSRARTANRSVSSCSRPIVLTTSAPSKLSWAIALVCARSAWARAMPRRHAARVDHVEPRTAPGRPPARPGRRSSRPRTARPTAPSSITDRADRERHRRDREPQRLDVGVRVGQQGAGRVAAVPGRRQLQVAPGHPAPVVRLQPELHRAGAEPSAEDGRHLQHGDGEQGGRRRARARPAPPGAVSNAGTTTRPTTLPMTSAPPTVSRPNTQLPTAATAKIRGCSRIARPSSRSPGPSVLRSPSCATATPWVARRRASPPSCRVPVLTLSRPSATGLPGPTLGTIRAVTHFAPAERTALADLLSELGPDAPTLCEGWTTRDLAAHLVVRATRPDAAAGIVIRGLADHTKRVQDQVAARRLGATWSRGSAGGRCGPRSATRRVNRIEYFIHHEDVRRAQPGWQPRQLAPESRRGAVAAGAGASPSWRCAARRPR